jgi:hypothetical protein
MMSEKSHCPAKNENETEQAKKKPTGRDDQIRKFSSRKVI